MFKTVYNQYQWNDVYNLIHSKKIDDVKRAMTKKILDLNDFAALISPAADTLLEDIAQLSREKSLKRFGKTIQLYTPIYLSNECQNVCTYCGFSFDNKIKRKTLSDEEIVKEAKAVKAMGFDHVLLVTGEANQTVNVSYFLKAIELVKPFFTTISIEVQPLETNAYQILHNNGVYAVLVYQETYNEEKYKSYHPKGKKSNFEYRLATPDRVGEAAMHKVGLGVLLGLEDWRVDSFYCALHLDYLRKKYWKTKYSVSFPRIRPAEGVSFDKKLISDRELVQLICAYRLFNEDLEISISTRESQKFRNNVLHIGATTLSAGSKTNPGGYSVEKNTLEQFEIDDNRSAKEIAQLIYNSGYEPVWKDWDRTFINKLC